MKGVIPIFDFHGIGNYRLLYQEPFMEEFRDPKTGLYLIGIGCSPLSVQLNGKIGTGTHTFIATLMAEYVIYADRDSLDYPRLVEDTKGVLHTSGLLNFSHNFFNSMMGLLGYSSLSTKDNKIIICEALENRTNRNGLGDLVVNELKDRNVSEGSKLYHTLQQYEKKDRKIIPLRHSSAKETPNFEPEPTTKAFI